MYDHSHNHISFHEPARVRDNSVSLIKFTTRFFFSIQYLLSQVDNAIQFGEDAEPKLKDHEMPYDVGDGDGDGDGDGGGDGDYGDRNNDDVDFDAVD